MQRARRPPKLAGLFQPCAATTLAASKNIPPSVGYRQPSPTVHKKGPPPHPASPRMPRSIRTKNQVERRLGHVASIGFPYAGASSPIVCSQWSAARVASRESAFPFSSEPRFGSGPFLIFKGKRARSSGTSPLQKKNGSDKKGLQIPPGTA